MRKKFVNFLNLILLLVLLLPSFSFAEVVSSNIISVKVNGLVCEFCARGLEKSFGKKEEVSEIKVDLEKSTVDVELEEGKDLTDEVISKLITENGISVVEISRAAPKIEAK